MSYCINPQCPNPAEQPNPKDRVCPHCGADLVLQNRYRILGLLGSGGFGKTFEAAEGKKLKVIKVLYKNHPKAVSLFQQEAKVLSRLSHPGIPKVEPDGYFVYWPPNSEEPVHCLVMEKIEGLNLSEWLEERKNQPIDKKVAIAWLEQLVEILEQVHKQHYFHRDIKPHNIMRRPDGQLVLIDFGTAREVTGTYLNKVGGGQNVTEIISAGYTPPEQINGKAVPQSDFYALGRTFVYLMTGKKPTEFPEHPRTGKLQWRDGAPQIPDALADIIDYMMAPFPGNRPQHAQMILRSLDEAKPQLSASNTGFKWPFKPNDSTSNPSSQKTPRASRALPTDSGLYRSGAPDLRSTGSGFRSTGGGRSTQSRLRKRQTSWSDRLHLSWQSVAAGAIAILAASQLYSYWRYGLFPASPWFPLSSLPSSGFFDLLLARNAGGRVYSLAVSPQNNIVASGSFRDMGIIALKNGVLLYERSVHDDWIRAIAFTPDGNTIVTASNDTTVRLWDARTGIRKLTLGGHSKAVNDIAISTDGRILVSASDDRTIRVWDLRSGRSLHTLQGHTAEVTSVALSADGNTLVSGGADKTLRVWNVSQGVQIRALTGHDAGVRSVALSPDGTTIASSSFDNTLRLWNVFPGAEIDRLEKTRVDLSTAIFSPDSRYLVGGGEAIFLWNLESGKREYRLHGHRGEVSALAFASNGRQLVSGGVDKTIKLWEMPVAP
ncbi:High-affnity carbon uptake protein Hat/HatR [Geitlerinema sp. FC II]|nr:serine/threonine protein kinase [Geitlerinema sp. CS-897]PPT06990.1 High-affnity carbon uptake protein Hat/HatR [Geitlerinema sp. FC II]